jgi:hypothetical protein
VAGLWGDCPVGTLQFTIPPEAPATAAYHIEFAKVSASPTGIGVFPQSVRNGVVSLASLQGSSWGDGIPDLWRLRYFGSLNDATSRASFDADHDGVSNGAEYQAGTNPMDARSVLRLQSRLVGTETVSLAATQAQVALRWSTVLGKRYRLESSPSMQNPRWTPLASELAGTGEEMEYLVAIQPSAECQYYRVRIVEKGAAD